MKAGDKQKLIAAIEGGPLSLGDIRREAEIQPEVVERLVTADPDLFKRVDVGGRPGVELRPPLSPLDAKLFRILKDCRSGVSLARLWSSNKVKTEDSRAFAERYSDLVTIVSRLTREKKLREFLVLKSATPVLPETPAPLSQATPDTPDAISSVMIADAASNAPESSRATPPPINSEIAARCALLILWLKAGWRSSDWLEAMGFLMAWVHEIIIAYPGLILLERNEHVGHFEFRVSLLKKPEQHSPLIVPPSQPKEEEGPVFSKEEWARMKARPPSRGMASRRNSEINPSSVQYRRRTPMIILPPAP
jgi:hypothetical protein